MILVGHAMPGAVDLPARVLCSQQRCMIRVRLAVRPRLVRCHALSTSRILFFPRDPTGILTSPPVFFLYI